MDKNNLVSTAQALVAPGKGILAADESTGTMTKRLKSINTESTPEYRRFYRQILFTTPGAEAHISGVILYDETIRQGTDDGTSFVETLKNKGIIAGIKVDEGTSELPFFPGELVTEGLDGLRGRLNEYRDMGAGFAKWRAVITIGDGIPSQSCIEANAEALARYAALCQEAGLVPIVEPEVLMDGEHDIERCQAVTANTLQTVYDRLYAHRVFLEGTLLKPNMVVPGKSSPRQVGDEEIARRTVETFRRVVPAAVPGIVFLSGGMSAEEATSRLSAMNAMGEHPWQLSFSYGRALQAPVLDAWQGKRANAEAAQQAFAHRARMNGLARSGEYAPEMEEAAGMPA